MAADRLGLCQQSRPFRVQSLYAVYLWERALPAKASAIFTHKFTQPRINSKNNPKNRLIHEYISIPPRR